MARNIEMNIKTESGYDVLYPSSTPSQVGCLATTGGTMSGNVNMNYNRIINVVTTEMNDVASKAYVDSKFAPVSTAPELYGVFSGGTVNLLNIPSSAVLNVGSIGGINNYAKGQIENGIRYSSSYETFFNVNRYWSKQGNSWNFTFPTEYVSFVWIQ